MKTVTSHRFAAPGGILLFDAIDGNQLCQLDGGSWIGVLAESDGWIQVITATENGWVKLEDTVEAKPFGLKALSNKVTGLIQNYVLL